MRTRTGLLWGLLGVFVLVEGAIIFRHPATHDLTRWVALLQDPFMQIVLVDFSGTAVLAFVWMLLDAPLRGASAWRWLPLLVFSPTLALTGYLLRRSRRPSPAAS